MEPATLYCIQFLTDMVTLVDELKHEKFTVPKVDKVEFIAKRKEKKKRKNVRTLLQLMEGRTRNQV